jgi:hypothetical protein
VRLVTTVSGAGVTCSFPSLNGPEITMSVATADKLKGGYITLTSNKVYVRIGAGSGSTYTQRNFSGPGVTNFDATKGASSILSWSTTRQQARARAPSGR